jgi:hypothetical protein
LRLIAVSKTGFPLPIMRHGVAWLQAESMILKNCPSAWKRSCKKKDQEDERKLDGIIVNHILALS